MRSSPWTVGHLFAACLLALAAAPSVALARAAPPKSKARTPAQVAAEVDRLIDRDLAKAKVPPSPRADDGEFIRRATIDVVGRIPIGERAATFLDSKAADKRTRLIDELLASPEYGRHFGSLWHNRIVPLNAENQREINLPMFAWLADAFNRNRPWSAVVSDLILAEGDRSKVPALGFYLSPPNTVEGYVHADRVAGSVAELFLGVNLRCAQCHDHPFAKWTQTDFWATAAFFGRVGFAKKTGEKVLVESKEVHARASDKSPTVRPDASIQIPGRTKIVKARFLGGKEPVLSPDGPFRPAFAAWLTGPENERFAEAAVNRLWAHFFGRGLVTPVNDLRDDNPPSHPELLKLLTREFIASGFDQKHVVRCICASNAYQRTSRPLAGNKADTRLISHAALRQMSAETLFDSVLQVLDGARYDKDLVKTVSNPGRYQWMVQFSTYRPDEEPTRYTHGVPQALRLLNSQVTNSHELPAIRKILRERLSREKGIEILYLEALSRRPRPAEVKLFLAHLAESRNLDHGYRDVWWALLNSSEFLFNH